MLIFVVLLLLLLSGSMANSSSTSALRENTGLTELRLRNCGINAEGISHLAQGLLVNTTLKVLDLERTPIHSEDAEHLALLLEGAHNLTELHLASCRIDEDSACRLARAICAYSTPLKLNLACNNELGERGVQALVESLIHNSNMELVLPARYKYTSREYGKVRTQIILDYSI